MLLRFSRCHYFTDILPLIFDESKQPAVASMPYDSMYYNNYIFKYYYLPVISFLLRKVILYKELAPSNGVAAIPVRRLYSPTE